MSTIREQKERIESEIHKLEQMGGSVTGQARRFRDGTFSRFPILFVLLSTFGLVCTLYGLEKVIDKIYLFEKYPLLILITGIVTLTISGTLFNKLQ